MSEPLGVILAGGLGRRIGGDKALVELGGRPLLSFPLEAMGEAVGEVVVIAKEETRLPVLQGVRAVRESGALHHPLVGIREALTLAGGRAALVCAGDMPFVDAALLRAIAQADPGGAPAVVAAWRDEPQPLLGCYYPAAAERLPNGGRLREVMALIGALLLEIPDPQALFNVNTPEDLRRAEAMLASGPPRA